MLGIVSYDDALTKFNEMGIIPPDDLKSFFKVQQESKNVQVVTKKAPVNTKKISTGAKNEPVKKKSPATKKKPDTNSYFRKVVKKEEK